MRNEREVGFWSARDAERSRAQSSVATRTSSLLSFRVADPQPGRPEPGRRFSDKERSGTMSVFDQRGQTVTYQYNAAGDINFGEVQNVAQLAEQIDKLRQEAQRAHEGGAIDADTAADVDHQLRKATLRARDASPDAKGIQGYLAEASSLVGKAGGAALALLSGLKTAAELAAKLMP